MNIPGNGKYQWLPTLYNVIEYLKPKKLFIYLKELTCFLNIK